MAAFTTIDDAGLFYQTQLYTGTDSSNAITLDGSENMSPSLVWIKNRGDSQDHFLVDAVRGASLYLEPNTTDADTSASGAFTSFDSDGFTLEGSGGRQNASGHTYVAWCWKGGTTTGIATDGSTTITPSGYSFNQTAGISILKYTGNSVSGAGLAHGLGVKPEFLVMKKTNSSGDNWQIYHQVVGYSNSGDLAWNTTSGQGSTANFSGEPDATNIFLGSNTINNGNTDTFICYAFAGIKGFSKIAGYTGNGNADGPFIYTGFKPSFILIKRYNTSGAWPIFDNKRNGYNENNKYLIVNTQATDGVGTYFNILSNGFKPLTSDGEWNGSSDNYAYMAFAENPFVNSSGVPSNGR